MASLKLARDPHSGAPVAPRHPDRICWGCDKYCPADDLACGNGTIRTPHPAELFGEDWLDQMSDSPRADGNGGNSTAAAA